MNRPFSKPISTTSYVLSSVMHYLRTQDVITDRTAIEFEAAWRGRFHFPGMVGSLSGLRTSVLTKIDPTEESKNKTQSSTVRTVWYVISVHFPNLQAFEWRV